MQLNWITVPATAPPLRCYLCSEAIEAGQMVVGLNCGHGADLEPGGVVSHGGCLGATLSAQGPFNPEGIRCPYCTTPVQEDEIDDFASDVQELQDLQVLPEVLFPPNLAVDQGQSLVALQQGLQNIEDAEGGDVALSTDSSAAARRTAGADADREG